MLTRSQVPPQADKNDDDEELTNLGAPHQVYQELQHKTCLQKNIIQNPLICCLILSMLVFCFSFLGGEVGSGHWLNLLSNQTLQDTIRQFTQTFVNEKH